MDQTNPKAEATHVHSYRKRLSFNVPILSINHISHARFWGSIFSGTSIRENAKKAPRSHNKASIKKMASEYCHILRRRSGHERSEKIQRLVRLNSDEKGYKDYSSFIMERTALAASFASRNIIREFPLEKPYIKHHSSCKSRKGCGLEKK